MPTRNIVRLNSPFAESTDITLEFDDTLYQFRGASNFGGPREIVGTNAITLPSLERVRIWVRRHCPSVSSLHFLEDKALLEFIACEACEVGPNNRTDGERILIPPMLVKLGTSGFSIMNGIHPHAKNPRETCYGDFRSVFQLSEYTFEWLTVAISEITRWRRVYNGLDCYVKPYVINQYVQERFDSYFQNNILVETLTNQIVMFKNLLKFPRGTSRRWCNACGGDPCWCTERCQSCGRNMTNGDCVCCPRCHTTTCQTHPICMMPACSCLCCRRCSMKVIHGPCGRCDDCCRQCPICHQHEKEGCGLCSTPICPDRGHTCPVFA